MEDIPNAPMEINNFVFTTTFDCVKSFFEAALQKLLNSSQGGTLVCVLSHCDASGEGGNSNAEFRRIVTSKAGEARAHRVCVNGIIYQASLHLVHV